MKVTNREDVRKIVRGYLVEAGFLNEKDSLDDQAELQADLGMDGLDQVEMCMTLEETIGIMIPDDDADEFETIKDVIDFIMEEGPKQPYLGQ